MKTKIAFASLACALLLAISQPSAQVPRPERISIFYGTPANKAHLPILAMLKEHQALEKIREILSPIRWPRTLKLEVTSCDGDANAWYEDAVVTVCYEYLQEMLNAANSRKRPEHVSRDDALVGPFVDTFLHEAGHAAFDLLKIPLLGREGARQEKETDPGSSIRLRQRPQRAQCPRPEAAAPRLRAAHHPCR
jgi:hypothetical protein